MTFNCYYFQVGDVVLVEDESVIENDFKMVGLETLVCLIFCKYMYLLLGHCYIFVSLCLLKGVLLSLFLELNFSYNLSAYEQSRYSNFYC